MTAFEVLLNGQRIATAGIGDLGILLAIIRWVRRPTDACTIPNETFSDVEICGQLFATNEHVVWADRPLRIGDEVLVRLVEVDHVDEPPTRISISEFPPRGNNQRSA